ncbi:MAG: hypothetical protein ACREPF_11820, partial [Rhodanobacteraceae bacterium]
KFVPSADQLLLCRQSGAVRGFMRTEPDCGGMDAEANIGEADGPKGAPQDAARLSSPHAVRSKNWTPGCRAMEPARPPE